MRTKLVRVAVRLPPNLVEELRRRSEKTGLRQSRLIRSALRAFLAMKVIAS